VNVSTAAVGADALPEVSPRVARREERMEILRAEEANREPPRAARA